MRYKPTFPAILHDGQFHFFGPAHEIEKTPSDEGEKWLRKFKVSVAGETALRALKSLEEKTELVRFERFKDLVLLECWWAYRYRNRGDHIWKQISAEHRRRTKIDLQLSKDTQSILRTLKRHYDANPQYVNAFVKEAFKKTIGPLAVEDHTAPLIDMLDNLDGLMEDQIRLAEPAKRSWIACIDYKKAVNDRNRPADEARAGLEFALALRFKHYTGAKGRARLKITNCTMPEPRDGKPCHTLVALFCRATLGSSPYPDGLDDPKLREDVSNMQQRLRKVRLNYEDATYVGWPVRI
jgi:hypothetical protein